MKTGSRPTSHTLKRKIENFPRWNYSIFIFPEIWMNRDFKEILNEKIIIHFVILDLVKAFDCKVKISLL